MKKLFSPIVPVVLIFGVGICGTAFAGPNPDGPAINMTSSTPANVSSAARPTRPPTIDNVNCTGSVGVNGTCGGDGSRKSGGGGNVGSFMPERITLMRSFYVVLTVTAIVIGYFVVRYVRSVCFYPQFTTNILTNFILAWCQILI